MDVIVAWVFLTVFWLLPLLHVAISPRSGSWRPPEGSRCPFGPRLGWLILVLLLGLIGWLMYIRTRHRRAASS